MRILLDECVPRRLGPELVGHVVRTVPQEGWSGKKNGELLALMSAAGFEVLLTVDQGIRHQQNLQAAGVAVVVMIGASNQLVDLVPLVPDVLVALSKVQPGDAVEVRA
jgi:PIN like domain